MQPAMQTERLALRAVRPDDVENFYHLDGDRRVMRYIGDGSIGTRDSVAVAVARTMKHYCIYPGLGRRSAEERSTGRFIGWFSLNYVPNTVEVEVGYRLLPDAWGNGYATEGAAALVHYGFGQLGLYRIIGLTHPDNAASQRVLRKAGLRDAGLERYYERDLRVFVAEACGDIHTRRLQR
jgi:[ribosomal protein S5]-alanine N-acetyltransferase